MSTDPPILCHARHSASKLLWKNLPISKENTWDGVFLVTLQALSLTDRGLECFPVIFGIFFRTFFSIEHLLTSALPCSTYPTLINKTNLSFCLSWSCLPWNTNKKKSTHKSGRKLVKEPYQYFWLTEIFNEVLKSHSRKQFISINQKPFNLGMLKELQKTKFSQKNGKKEKAHQ